MTLRRLLSALGLGRPWFTCGPPGAASAATYETTNFVVNAPTAELARKFGEMAEPTARRRPSTGLAARCPPGPSVPAARPARDGLGRRRDHLHLRLRGNRPVVTSQRMEIRGDAKQLLNSVLPHEVTHTVLAYHFGRAVPRWADEGGSVLSENDEERFSHDVRCRELLNAGRGIVLRTLFRMAEYPRDMIVLYAQGY